MTGTEIREAQRQHIVGFLANQDFTGRVLDYGCGVAPYRAIVEERGGEWHGYNRGIYPGGSTTDIGPDMPFEEQWDVVLCTQVLQYVPDPAGLLAEFRAHADRLVLTVATNWPEVEQEDLHRFTMSGITRLLEAAGWEVNDQAQLGAVAFGDREWCALGYGVVCK